jgi:hypothetical protein
MLDNPLAPSKPKFGLLLLLLLFSLLVFAPGGCSVAGDNMVGVDHAELDDPEEESPRRRRYIRRILLLQRYQLQSRIKSLLTSRRLTFGWPR